MKTSAGFSEEPEIRKGFSFTGPQAAATQASKKQSRIALCLLMRSPEQSQTTAWCPKTSITCFSQTGHKKSFSKMAIPSHLFIHICHSKQESLFEPKGRARIQAFAWGIPQLSSLALSNALRSVIRDFRDCWSIAEESRFWSAMGESMESSELGSTRELKEDKLAWMKEFEISFPRNSSASTFEEKKEEM